MKELHLFNTLGREKQLFKPTVPDKVKFYSCGPTVYDYVHIGNLRYFTFVDTLRRVLEYAGYDVHHVMNITDVGHLVSDEDLGQDKMLKALERERKNQGKDLTVWDVAKFYTDAFLEDVTELKLEAPKDLTKATDHIQQMIDLIKDLVDKGYAYATKEAVYFDVMKFKDYTKLSGQHIEDKLVGSRDDVVVDPNKKHPADFRIWQLDQPDHAMLWDSPWGRGFPGWHIECSAMAMAYLGQTLDIHTGGIDHIPVHHTNEIAQSEASTGKNFANYWLHVEFLRVDDQKMSKSKGNGYNLRDIKAKGFDPLVLKYFYLGAHYRSTLNFTWKALEASESAYNTMREQVMVVRSLYDKAIYEGKSNDLSTEEQKALSEFIKTFDSFILDDLNTPGALSILWEVLKSQYSYRLKYSFLKQIDHVFGFNFFESYTFYENPDISQDEKWQAADLLNKRATAKLEKLWAEADSIRDQLTQKALTVIDTAEGTVVIPMLQHRKAEE